MKSFFKIKDGSVVEATEQEASVVIYSELDEQCKQELIDTIGITRHDIDSALDPDEVSRVEYTPEYTYIIWKRPNSVSFEQQLKFEVSSVGVVLQPNRLTIILGENTLPSFSNNAFRKAGTLNSLLLKFFLYTVHHYFGHLKAIRALAAELQGKLNISIENRYLLQMFTLGESLVYYINALEANTSVLRKLRAISERIGLSADDAELLDDVLIEQQQCSSQTQIYSAVLSGLMDARGSIINNNMNVLLRNLTIINVVFMPLNLIAGIGGMSEYSMMTGHADWRIAYGLFFLAMIAIGWLTWLLLMRKIGAESKPGKPI